MISLSVQDPAAFRNLSDLMASRFAIRLLSTAQEHVELIIMF